MNGLKISPKQFSNTIWSELDNLVENTADKVKRAVQDAANSAVKELKKTSPKKTGKYAKSWTQKRGKETSSGTEIVVYAKEYRLTHLLEKGHAKRGGGRAAAIVHIKPVEEKVSEQLEKEIKRMISGG